jgi:hypothetical protein
MILFKKQLFDLEVKGQGPTNVITVRDTPGGVSINRLTLILKIISQCDVKHVIKLQIKTITSVLMILTGITTSIAAHSTRLTISSFEGRDKTLLLVS